MDPMVQWILGGVFTAVVTIGGGLIKYLFNRMEKHEANTIDAIDKLRSEVEDRRKESHNYLLELVNTKFDAIWETLRDLKDKIN